MGGMSIDRLATLSADERVALASRIVDNHRAIGTDCPCCSAGDGGLKRLSREERITLVVDLLDLAEVDVPVCQPKGCGAKLAAGQYFVRCGETDMGQTDPALCEQCGGTFRRA